MRLFPIVAREMRVASRKGGTYWNRTVVALVAIAVAVFTMMVLSNETPKDRGFMIFMWMSIVGFAHCLITGVLLTADCLAEEKRDGTLGLLFLTDLKGYDVVFGKLFASSLRGAYGVLAIVPVLGLSLLLGGVAPAEFARVVLVCANSLFLSLSVGMMTSALCRDERRALTIAFLIMLVLTAGFPALGGWMAWKLRLDRPPYFPFAFSPGYASALAFDAVLKIPKLGPKDFYAAVITQHVMAWGALAIACRVVPRSWQDKIASAASEKRGKTLRQWVYGSPALRLAFRRRLLAVNPYYWLVSRDRFKQAVPWLWLAAGGVIWFFGLLYSPADWKEEGAYVMTALILHTLFKVWVAFESSRQLGGDRQSGALELLLCTPISVHEILRGQWLGLMRQFGTPALIVCGADIVFLIAGWPFSEQARKEWFVFCAAGISVFVIDLITIAWTAMWLGLLRRRTGQAGVHALVRICGVPWICYAALLLLFAMLDHFGLLRPSGAGRWIAPYGPLWWIISGAISIAFGYTAYRRLHQNLRAVAAERFVGRGAMWGRALGLAYGKMRTGEVTKPPGGPAAGAGASTLQ